MRLEFGALPKEQIAELKKIKFSHELVVAHFILTLNTNAHLIYEPQPFEMNTREANRLLQGQRSTVPDFRVINKETNEDCILEVTRKSAETKKKQRKILRSALPDTPFIIFSGQELKAIKRFGRPEPIEVFSYCKTPPMQELGRILIPNQFEYFAAD